jgi:CheY-like chemotaxis protein
MDDYLIWGAGVAVLVLLLVVQLIRRRARRPVAQSERADRGAARALSPPSRSASELDTVSDVHELKPARPASSEDLRLRAEREAAEQAARAEADREAAEWEAQLVAQQLADEERERARIAAEQAPVQVVAPPPETAAVADEQAVLEALAREAAEWEARLAAQQLADAESERMAADAAAEQAAAAAAAAAQEQRAAEELAAQQVADQLAAQHASRVEAERRVQEEAQRLQAQLAAQALAEAQTQADAAAGFEFRLEPEAAPPASPAPSSVLAPRTPEQCLIMIADDSKVVRIKTSRLLAKHLYRVSLAEDGLDAARQIELDLPDVLITDVEMPGMDGFELTRQVRSNPRTAHIPIVMITADDVKHRADAIEAGVSVLLSKPYPEDQLLSYLESTLTRAVAVP